MLHAVGGVHCLQHVGTLPARCTRPAPHAVQEASVMVHMRHPNLLNFLGLCTLPPCLLTGGVPDQGARVC